MKETSERMQLDRQIFGQDLLVEVFARLLAYKDTSTPLVFRRSAAKSGGSWSAQEMGLEKEESLEMRDPKVRLVQFDRDSRYSAGSADVASTDGNRP